MMNFTKGIVVGRHFSYLHNKVLNLGFRGGEEE